MIRLAFGSVPKDGGTFTFYRNMRAPLLQYGIDMRCVAIGKDQAELWEDIYVDEGCVLLAHRTRSVKRQAQAFTDWCVSEKIDLVMGINSEAILSSLPHLPERIRCMARCANSFDHGYRITLSGYERLAAIIAQTPRQFKDLTESYGADPSKITVIPNGIEPEPFSLADNPISNPASAEPPIRLGFLGRLEHKQKGVLFLPEILRSLDQRGINYTLRIAGKGRHQSDLETGLSTQIAQGKVSMMGTIPPTRIPQFLAETEVLLFPSQFEGCPNALLEAMMAGCAPVAWQLPGITDFIIENQHSGLLSPLGQCPHFADHICSLAADRIRLASIRRHARKEAEGRFTTRIAAAEYGELIHAVMSRKAPPWTPKTWSSFKPDSNFEHSWKDRIPQNLKDRLKAIIRTS